MSKEITLADLKIISKSSGIPLATLQKEYGVYEYTFTSCHEAREKYDGGYLGNIFHTVDYANLEVIAYHKAWKEISIKEQPDVAKLTFEQAIEFAMVCCPHGEHFLAVLAVIENLAGENIEKIAQFINGRRTLTFYAHSECPVQKLSERMMKKVDVQYQKRIIETKSLVELYAISDEVTTYQFGEFRPFPDLFEVMRRKAVRFTKTIAELHELKLGWGTEKISRWEKLLPQATLKEIFVSLKDFLMMILNTTHDRGAITWKIHELYDRCQELSEAEYLLDLDRKFTLKNEDDTSDRCYDGYFFLSAKERILKKELPKYVSIERLHLFANRSLKGTSLEKTVDSLWIKATQKALRQPIPDFAKLYGQAHKSLQAELVAKWNTWSMEQLAGVESWEDLISFDIAIMPRPKRFRGNNSYCIWPERRELFSTFIIYLHRLIRAAPDIERLNQVFDMVIANQVLIHSFPNAPNFFADEVVMYASRTIEFTTAEEILWAAYLKIQVNMNGNHNTSKQILLDKMILVKPEMLDRILTVLKEGEALYKIYMRKKVDALLI